MSGDHPIARFLHGQVQCWNTGDQDGFFQHYQRVAAQGLTLEYVGRPLITDGWAALRGMWAQQQPQIEVEVVVAMINGNEAACHHLNHRRDGSGAVHTLELYRFEPGRLSVRYFINMP